MYLNLMKRRDGFWGNDEYTKLLLHCNGTDAATSFPDSSASGHTVTAVANAQVDTAQKKFGTASALFDGTGDYLSVADSDDWYMAAEPFTIDFWLRPTNYTSSPVLFSQWVDSSNYVDFIKLTTGFPDYDDCLKLRINTAEIIVTSSIPSTATWTHVAVIRGWGSNVDDWAVTFDGTAVGTATNDSTAWPQLAAPLAIGGYTGSGNKLNGWIEEFRVSKGVARWTTSFTPPTIPYR
jgi:hypothetical protein